MQEARQVISETVGEIKRCNDCIAQIESDSSELTRQIEELKLEASRYHEERGEIRHLIVFVNNAQNHWREFAEATKLVEKLTNQAQKKCYLGFFTRGAGKHHAMSFLEAWEEVQKLAEGGSEYIFQMDFECSHCGSHFRSLPYARNMDLVCSSCHFST